MMSAAMARTPLIFLGSWARDRSPHGWTLAWYGWVRGAVRRAAGLACGVLALLGAPAAQAGPNKGAELTPQPVLELFSSQSCSSCPAAEEVLADISRSGEALTLEWHVDYWDTLVAGTRGRWKDPFSAPAHTARQRAYNLRLRRTRSVYTPQMIVAGRHELPGFHKAEVKRLLSDLPVVGGAIRVRIMGGKDTGFQLALNGKTSTPLEVWRVDVLDDARTAVQRGENKGRTLDNHNIVRGAERVGLWPGGPVTLDLRADQAEMGTTCRVLLQEPDQGPVHFGLTCPST